MAKKPALVLLTVISPLLLATLASDAALAVGLSVPLICALPVLLMVVGTGDRRPPGWTLLTLWLVLTSIWLTLLWLSAFWDLSHPSAGEATVVLVLMFVGLGLLPLVLVGWTFWRWFSSQVPSTGDLRGLRGGEGS